MNMNKIFSKSVNVLLAIFVLFTVLPIKINYSSIIIVLSILSLFNVVFIKNKNFFKHYSFILSIPFFVYAIGLINTSDFVKGIDFLTRNASFLAFPLIFYSLSGYINTKFLLKIYLLSLFLIDLYLIYLFIYYFNFGERFYKIVTVDIYHSTYLGMYNLVGFWLIITRFKNLNLLAFFFLFSALFTSSRIVFIIGVFSVLIIIFRNITSPNLKIGGALFVVLFAFIIINKTPSLRQKFDEITEINKIGFDKHNYKSISSRFGKLEASLKVIEKYPILGAGTGDLMSELVLIYQEMNFTAGIKKKYNPHNQFLDNIARNGVLGIVSLVIIYFLPLYVSKKEKDSFYLSFVLVIIGVSLTESILDVHKGITFYTFFNTMLFYDTLKDQKTNSVI